MTENGEVKLAEAPTTPTPVKAPTLKQRVDRLENEIAELKARLTPAPAPAPASAPAPPAAPPPPPKPPSDAGKQLLKMIIAKLVELAAEPPKPTQ